MPKNLEKIKGQFSVQPQIVRVSEISFWDHEMLEAAEGNYRVYEDRVFERFLDLGKDSEEFRAKFDETVSMAKYLWGYWVVNGIGSTEYQEEHIFEALVLFTAAGYFLDDDNDQEEQDPAILGEKAKSFLSIIKKIFSEAIENPKETMKKYKLAKEMSPGNKDYVLASAAADMMAIISLNSSPEFARRFSNLLFEHWSESFTTDKNHIPQTVDEYRQKRIKSSGMKPTIELAELAMGIKLTAELREQLDEAILAVAEYGGLLNDILSAPKELIDEKSHFNLIRVLEIRENLNTAQAFERAFSIVNESFDRFQDAMFRLLAKEEITEEEVYIVQAYKLALEQIVWASVHWQLSTQRYVHRLHPVKEFLPEET